MTEKDLEPLDEGGAIATRPDGWVRGQLDQLEDVHEDIDRTQKMDGWVAQVSERLRGVSETE